MPHNKQTISLVYIVMGVPGFARTVLATGYATIPQTGWDWVAIDGNVLLHTVADAIDAGTLESAEFHAAFLHLLDCILKYLHPQEGVVIVLDGVPHRAKVLEQRARRCHRVKNADSFNRNVFTPGLVFMERLSDVVMRHTWPAHLQAHISPCTEPGEGEHKAIRIALGLVSRHHTLAIVSNDADVFVILASRATQLPKTVAYVVRPDTLRFTTLQGVQDVGAAFAKTRMDMEFVADVCHFFGNDYMPRPFSMNLYTKGAFHRFLATVEAPFQLLPITLGSWEPARDWLLSLSECFEKDEVYHLVHTYHLDNKDALVSAVRAAPLNKNACLRMFAANIDNGNPVDVAGMVWDYLMTWVWTQAFYRESSKCVDSRWVYAHPRAPFWFEVHEELLSWSSSKQARFVSECHNLTSQANPPVLSRTVHATIVLPECDRHLLVDRVWEDHQRVCDTFRAHPIQMESRCQHVYQVRPSLTQDHQLALNSLIS